jgi:hypothetical protein
MRIFHRTVLLATLCLAFGFFAAKVFDVSPAYGQPNGPVGAARFQISAYPGGGAGNANHGAYIIDTMTGKLWRVTGLNLPEQVPGRLQ